MRHPPSKTLSKEKSEYEQRPLPPRLDVLYRGCSFSMETLRKEQTAPFTAVYVLRLRSYRAQQNTFHVIKPLLNLIVHYEGWNPISFPSDLTIHVPVAGTIAFTTSFSLPMLRSVSCTSPCPASFVSLSTSIASKPSNIDLAHGRVHKKASCFIGVCMRLC